MFDDEHRMEMEGFRVSNLEVFLRDHALCKDPWSLSLLLSLNLSLGSLFLPF